MKPILFSYLIFNPAHLIRAYKEIRDLHGGGKQFNLVIESAGVDPIRVRAIDEVELQGLLIDFYNLWLAATV